VPNVELGKTVGSPLSTWGCRNVNASTPHLRNSASGAIYVIEVPTLAVNASIRPLNLSTSTPNTTIRAVNLSTSTVNATIRALNVPVSTVNASVRSLNVTVSSGIAVPTTTARVVKSSTTGRAQRLDVAPNLTVATTRAQVTVATTTTVRQDCRWSDWDDWSSCSTSCGIGTRARSRTIAQEAKTGGLACVGSFNETGSCAAQDQSGCGSNELAGSLQLVVGKMLERFLTEERSVRCLGEAVAALAGIPDDFVRIELTNLTTSKSNPANANADFKIVLDDLNVAADFAGLPPVSAFDLYTAMSRITTSRVNDTVNLACSMKGLDSVFVSGWTPPPAPLTNLSRPAQARKAPIFLVGSFRFTAPSCGVVADDVARRSFRKLLFDIVNTTLKDDETPVAITVKSSQQANCELDATYGIDLRREAMERNFSGGRPINGTSICAQLLALTPTTLTRKVNDFLVAASSSTLVDVIRVTCAGGFPNPSLYYTQTSTTTTTKTVSRVATEAPVGRQLAAVTTETTTTLAGTTKMYFESYKIRNAAGRDLSLVFVVGLLSMQQLQLFS
jgi:hypothetical protein